jgi:hypothetical protein
MTNSSFGASTVHSSTRFGPTPRRDAWRWWTLPGWGPLLLAVGGVSGAHAAGPVASTGAAVPVAVQSAHKAETSRLWMAVGERRFAISLAGTEAARAFAAMLPLTLDMADLHGNEKQQDLPTALPTDTRRPGTIRHGDLMLWGSRTLVVFYLTFDSPYAYTRLGRVDDPAGLAQALGRGDVRVTFSVD